MAIVGVDHPHGSGWRDLLANLDDLVVKPANESGGYGLFMGPTATAAEKDEVRERMRRGCAAGRARRGCHARHAASLGSALGVLAACHVRA